LTQLGRALRELGIGWIPANSAEAQGRVERSFLTAQDRLVKDLRLAKVRTMEAANAFLEKEYWPGNSARFARPIAEFPDQHRPLTPHLDLAGILCHVEQRVIANDYLLSFAGRQFQIARQDIQPAIRSQHLRIEVRLDGDLCARDQGRYLTIARCGQRPEAADPSQPPRRDHNAGGKSRWMQGFFDCPAPPLWQCLD
jgi:hypothetical protein